MMQLPRNLHEVGVAKPVTTRFRARIREAITRFEITEPMRRIGWWCGGMTTPHEDPNDLGPVIAGLLGVMAMAVQNAGSRLILANHGPTTMMTGNTTQAVIDLVDLLRGLPGETPQARKRLILLVPAILAFTVGALLGALSYVAFSFCV